MVVDFLRVGNFDLDTIELYGSFGNPNKRPFKCSGLSTEFNAAVFANPYTLERLWVNSHGLDLSLTELKRILHFCQILRDLGLS